MNIGDKTIIAPDLNDTDHETHENDVLIVIGGHLNGSIFEINMNRMTAGRSDDCEINLNAPGISRLHFELWNDGRKIEIVDLDSSNGTYVNNKKIDARVSLQSGDVIKAGHLALKYLTKDSPEIGTHKKLIDQATKDGLTGCFNKKYLFEALERELLNSLKGNEILCLIVIDIDFFKVLNDTEGHDAGDLVLKDLALLLQQKFVRRRDVFARFGGEEFVLLLMDTPLVEAGRIAESIRVAVEQASFSYFDKTLKITISLGIAHTIPGQKSSPHELFIKADKALYVSKQKGRNRVSFFEEE